MGIFLLEIELIMLYQKERNLIADVYWLIVPKNYAL